MKRKDFIDGIALLTFSLLLSGLSVKIGESYYLFGLISPSIMIILLSLGAIFCLISGGSILLGKGHWWFRD